MKALTRILPKALLPTPIPSRTNLKELAPTILLGHPLWWIAVGLAADLDKGVAVMFAHVGVVGWHRDVVLGAEVIDGVEGVGVVGDAFDFVDSVGADAHEQTGC